MQPHSPTFSALWKWIRDLIIPVLLAFAAATGLRRIIYPSERPRPAAAPNGFGTVILHLRLPGTSAGIPEPLLSCGTPGQASLVFIRLLPRARARIGIDFWGLELDQGPEFELPRADAVIDVTCKLPCLYPPHGDPAWGSTTVDVQRRRQRDFEITVNGVIRLNGAVNYVQAPKGPLFFGSNPIGGSYVSSLFTGRVVGVEQVGEMR